MAQNLVPNPGFEAHSTCADPPSGNSLANCSSWFNAISTGTSVDWYSTCFPSGSFYLLPDLFFGFGYPHSGDAMIGFVPYSNITNIGETVGVKLTQPMKQDSAYCFEFWIQNSRNHDNNYKLSEFDVAFVADTSMIDHKSEIPSYITLENSSEDGDWTRLSGYHIAQGGEQYLLIGVFQPVPDYYMQNPVTSSENCLYYFFDDVSVQSCNKDSLLSVQLDLPNVFTPNGDTTNATYRIRMRNIEEVTVQVFNRWGNLVKEFDGLNEQWDGTTRNGSPVEEGVYFIRAVAVSRFGETFAKQQFVHVLR